MRKVLLVVGLLAALAAAGSFGIRAARADSAVVVHGGGCGLVDANADFFFDPDGTQTAVLSGSGNSKITCHSQLPSSSTPPKSAVRWDFDSLSAVFGFPVPCSTEFGLTTKYLLVVTPGGQVVLTCHVNPSAD